MPFEGIEKGGKLIKAGGKTDKNLILSYEITAGYFLNVCGFNAKGGKSVFFGKLAYIKGQVGQVSLLCDEII